MNFRFDRYVQNLDISDNVIESLNKTSLRDLGVISLVQLNASRNYIKETDEEAFLGQSKLQTVDLSSNSLMIIEPKIFIRNPSLEILSLSSNQHLRLPEEGPFLYSPSLRVLQLAACNLSHIPPNTFQELPNLQELYIAYNKIGMLYNVQGVGHLTTLDISHNYLRDLSSDIFTDLHELIHLNLSYNSLSTLNITVMPQLVNVSRSIDLNGNPWVCDCLMFNTVYSWCQNNSVDLELVCASPAKFKRQPWNIYEHSGCYNDTSSKHFEYPVEVIASLNDTLPHEHVAKYIDQSVPHFSPGKKRVQLVRANVTYFYTSIALMVAFLGLLAGAGFLLWRRLRPRILRRSGPVHSDAETHHLSSSTI
jgi:Leucine-rich repeat (LRR) protein